MTRWTDAFDLARQDIDKLIELQNKVSPDDLSVIEHVSEINRLKKIIIYLDEIMKSLDPELVPLGTWTQFSQQVKTCLVQLSHYQASKNIAYITSANDYADNMLNYIRPYLIQKGRAKTINENVFQKTQIDLEKYLKQFYEKGNAKLEEINLIREDSLGQKDKLDSMATDVEIFNRNLFGSEKNTGYKAKITDLYDEINTKCDDINDFHEKLLNETDSIQTQVESATEEVFEGRDNVTKLSDQISGQVEDLNAFYSKIFGKVNDEDMRVGGLSSEITTRLKVLRDLENDNQVRYDAVVTEIQKLLPGATSAGLAKAYRDMKESFTDSIKWFEGLFYISIGILIILSLLSSVSLEWKQVGDGVEFFYGATKYSTLEEAFRVNLFKIPLYATLIWFAFFASKRRSENQRLQQEYAHKEALASSYVSYKKQLEDLDEQDNSLQKDLINKTVNAIAYNASQTLDGKHGDNHPSKEVMDRIIEKFPEIRLEELRGLFK
jgi:tetrahydromethanopterin S-methyltransferase subunit B